MYNLNMCNTIRTFHAQEKIKKLRRMKTVLEPMIRSEWHSFDKATSSSET